MGGRMRVSYSYFSWMLLHDLQILRVFISKFRKIMKYGSHQSWVDPSVPSSMVSPLYTIASTRTILHRCSSLAHDFHPDRVLNDVKLRVYSHFVGICHFFGFTQKIFSQHPPTYIPSFPIWRCTLVQNKRLGNGKWMISLGVFSCWSTHACSLSVH